MAMNGDGFTEQIIKQAEKVFPQLSREGLEYRFGCFAPIVHFAILCASLCLPAIVAETVVGNPHAYSWGDIILFLFVFNYLSSFVFTVAGYLVGARSKVQPETLEFEDYLRKHQRLQRLSPIAVTLFVNAGETNEMDDLLFHQLPFRFQPQTLQTILGDSVDLDEARNLARELAVVGLITLSEDLVVFTEDGVQVFLDAWKALKEQNDQRWVPTFRSI